MSFRSRSNTKPVAPPRRRSSSLTRSTGTSNNYQTPSLGYQTTSNGRPFSVHGSSTNFPTSNYGSNQNLRTAGGDYRRSSFGQANGSMKFPVTTQSYVSPYKDRYSHNGYGSPNSASGYTSAYKDRAFYNPYTSYDNGVTTASLSIPGSSMKRDYAPIRSNNSLSVSSAGIGGSTTNLINNGQSINETVANIGRSQSLREHERKSRSRKCKEAVKAAVPDDCPYDGSGLAASLSTASKSLSQLSLQSEGYEVIRSKKFLVAICLKILSICNFVFFILIAVWERITLTR